MWKWIVSSKTNKVVAIIALCLLVAALASAISGYTIRSRSREYSKLARGWADAYHRDVVESRKQAEQIKVLKKERDYARKKYQVALEMMKVPWKPPADAAELERRFRDRGLKGRVTP